MLLISLLFFCGSQALSASLCRDLFVRPEKDWDPQAVMAIYRFYGQRDLNRAHVATYNRVNKEWSAFHAGTLAVHGKTDGKSSILVERLQNFSTQVMLEQKVISRETKERQPSLLNHIGPAQMTFIELSHATGRRRFNELPDHLKSDLPEDIMPGQRLEREAGLWLISGQYLSRQSTEAHKKTASPQKDRVIPWDHSYPMRYEYDRNDPYLIEFAIHDLPWQRNPKLIEHGRLPINRWSRHIDLDRTRFPIAFEIGRGAAVEPGRLDEMMKIATGIMVREVDLMTHSRIEQAFAFANVSNPKLIARFKKQGFEILEEACISPQLCVMYIPLTRLVDYYKPEGSSQRMQRMLSILPRAGDVQEVHRSLDWNQSLYRSDLDFTLLDFGIHQKSPIVLEDYSSLNWNLRRLFLMKLGTPQEQVNTKAHELGQLQVRHDVRDRQLYTDPIPIVPFEAFLNKNNLIRISNLDASYANNPNYVPLLVAAVDFHLKRRIGDPHWTLHKNPEYVLEVSQASYALQTTNSSMAAHMRSIPGFQEVNAVRLNSDSVVYTFVVQRAWIKDFVDSNPGLEQILQHWGIDQGPLFFESMISQPFQY